MIVDVLFLGFDVKSYRLVCHFRVLRPSSHRPKYVYGETRLPNHNLQVNSSTFIFTKVKNWFKKIQRRFAQITTIRILAYPLSKRYQSVLFRL